MNNRTQRQKEKFPILLNDSQRYGICLRISLNYSTRMVQAWLQEAGVKISYAGLRRYWHRKRWVRLTDSIRANITSRPEAQQLIREAVLKWLEAESDAFMRLGNDLRDDLRKLSSQDPKTSERYKNAGYFLVAELNKGLNRATELIKALSITRVEN